MRCSKARHTQTYWGSSTHLGREQSSSHTACTMRGSNPRRIHQSALLWESWRFLQIKFNPPRPLRQCGNTRHLVKGSEEQLTQGSSILPSRPCPPSDDFPRWNETSASGSGVVGLIQPIAKFGSKQAKWELPTQIVHHEGNKVETRNHQIMLQAEMPLIVM